MPSNPFVAFSCCVQLEVRCLDRHPLQSRQYAKDHSSWAAWQSQFQPKQPQRGSRECTLWCTAMTGSASTQQQCWGWNASLQMGVCGPLDLLQRNRLSTFQVICEQTQACASPQGHAVLTSPGNESTTHSLQLQAANVSKNITRNHEKATKICVFQGGWRFWEGCTKTPVSARQLSWLLSVPRGNQSGTHYSWFTATCIDLPVCLQKCFILWVFQ